MLGIKIYCWDTTFKGEATLVLFRSLLNGFSDVIHIVDFGANILSRSRNRYGYDIYYNIARVLDEARHIINSHSPSRIDAVITHFHYDHFNLIPFIIDSSRKIKTAYVPGIPLEPKKVKDLLLRFIAAELILLDELAKITYAKSFYEVLKKIETFNIVYRDRVIKLDNKQFITMKVVWPLIDLSSISGSEPYVARVSELLDDLLKKFHRIINGYPDERKQKVGNRIIGKIEAVKAFLEEIISRLQKIRGENNEIIIKSEDLVNEFEKKKGEKLNIPDIFNKDLYEKCYEDERCKIIYEALQVIDKALNSFSLIIEYRYMNRPIIIIPGDNDEEVLNYVNILEGYQRSKRTIFMRGSHHGTYFGNYLARFKPIVTWLSQSEDCYDIRYRLNSTYIFTAKEFRKINISINNIFRKPEAFSKIYANVYVDADLKSVDVSTYCYDKSPKIRIKNIFRT